MKDKVEAEKSYLYRGGRCALPPHNFYLGCHNGR